MRIDDILHHALQAAAADAVQLRTDVTALFSKPLHAVGNLVRDRNKTSVGDG